MVSFQCDACVDVVKKPKLDNHYSRCNSSFTCVDCSKTFHGPSQWKSHTSCVSEAEKYQKSLYKGKKAVDGTLGKKADVQNNDQGSENNVVDDLQGKSTDSSPSFQRPGYRRPVDLNASVPNQRNVRNGVQRQSMSRGGSRTGRPYGSNFGFQRSMATGANDTPLGTPLRMVSPPNLIESNMSTLPHVVDATAVGATKVDVPLQGETTSKNKGKIDKKDKSGKKQMSDVAPDLEMGANDASEQNGTISSIVQGPSGNNGNSATESTKKSKKRKSEAYLNTASNDTNTEVDPDSSLKVDEKIKNKKKKRKLDDTQENNAPDDKIAQNTSVDRSKKRKKEKGEALADSRAEFKSSSPVSSRTKNTPGKDDLIATDTIQKLKETDKTAGTNSPKKKKKGNNLAADEINPDVAVVESSTFLDAKKDKAKRDKSKKKQKVSSKDS